MSPLVERRLQWMGMGLAVAMGAGAVGFTVAALAEAPAPTVRVIKVSSKRYEFIPRQITVKKGETVDLELTTEDVVMGFSLPDAQTRATILPGQAAHVRLTMDHVGTFTFLCDVFCGSGHEDMDGTIVVTD